MDVLLKCGANPNEKLEGSGEFRNALVAAMSALSTAGTVKKKAWERAKAIVALLQEHGADPSMVSCCKNEEWNERWDRSLGVAIGELKQEVWPSEVCSV